MTQHDREGLLMPAEAWFPPDWLDPKAGDTATDLDLAVLLVNSYDALVEPPDRLEDLGWLTAVLARVGHSTLADELDDNDIAALRDLRGALRSAFESSDVASVANILNPLMADAAAIPLLVTDDEEPPSAHLEVGVGARGLAWLQARLPVALAQHVDRYGVARLGTCGADPCHCAFVDRTRGGTRRYCCVWCNDRSAARAYRLRHRS